MMREPWASCAAFAAACLHESRKGDCDARQQTDGRQEDPKVCGAKRGRHHWHGRLVRSRRSTLEAVLVPVILYRVGRTWTGGGQPSGRLSVAKSDAKQLNAETSMSRIVATARYARPMDHADKVLVAMIKSVAAIAALPEMLEHQCRGGEVIVSEAVAQDAETAAVLADRTQIEETAILRGVSAPVRFLRNRGR